jgi:CheY-like chemotaxis protein
VVPGSKTCARCGWSNVRPSPRQGLIDGLLAIFFLAPFRCRNCRHRFFRFSTRLPGIPAKPPVHVVRPVMAQLPALTILSTPAVVDEEATQSAVMVEEPAAPLILVADIDPSIRKLLRRVLERQGYAIHELATPNDIVSTLRDSQVDLVITDLNLPRREALETIPLLQAQYPDLKIILLSGYWADEVCQSNDVALLPKPFRTQMLLESVRNALMSA